jgi:hypothetical protein
MRTMWVDNPEYEENRQFFYIASVDSHSVLYNYDTFDSFQYTGYHGTQPGAGPEREKASWNQHNTKFFQCSDSHVNLAH